MDTDSFQITVLTFFAKIKAKIGSNRRKAYSTLIASTAIILLFIVCLNSAEKSPSSETESETLTSKKKRKMAKNLNQILKDFVKDRITIFDEKRKQNVEAAKKSIEEELIKEMKNTDPLFRELYQNIYYAGSFYDGLRVSAADEFDLNVRLKLPFKPENIEIVTKGTPKGYVKYKLKDSLEKFLFDHPKRETYREIKNLMDGTYTYLSQTKVIRWIVGIIDKTMQRNPAKFRNISRSTNGPAATLKLRTNEGDLDIDLVPVVELPKLPDSVRKMDILKTIPPNKVFSFIVPKPHETDQTGTLWRVSLPEVERHLMDSKHCLKPLIKIIKAVRDNYEWKGVASYYIKTMFLYQVEKHPNPEFWKEADMGNLFKMMLEIFINMMANVKLNHFFFDDFNLLRGIRKDTAVNIKGRLERILKAAESDISKLPALLRNGLPDRPAPIRAPCRPAAPLQSVPVIATQRTETTGPKKETSEWKCIVM